MDSAVAIASVITSGAVAVILGLAQVREGRRAREHERALAREGRNQERRETTYLDLIRLMNLMIRGTPWHTPELPEAYQELEPLLMDVRAHVAAFASSAVRDQYTVFIGAVARFIQTADEDARSDMELAEDRIRVLIRQELGAED